MTIGGQYSALFELVELLAPEPIPALGPIRARVR